MFYSYQEIFLEDDPNCLIDTEPTDHTTGIPAQFTWHAPLGEPGAFSLPLLKSQYMFGATTSIPAPQAARSRGKRVASKNIRPPNPKKKKIGHSAKKNVEANEQDADDSDGNGAGVHGYYRLGSGGHDSDESDAEGNGKASKTSRPKTSRPKTSRSKGTAPKDTVTRGIKYHDPKSKYPPDRFVPGNLGYDDTLPPITANLPMFDHFTGKAVDTGLLTAIKDLGSKYLDIATMCSGSESPILGITQIAKSKQANHLHRFYNNLTIRAVLKSKYGVPFHFEQPFAAEIHPQKAAFIERNVNSKVILRDIIEFITKQPEPGQPCMM